VSVGLASDLELALDPGTLMRRAGMAPDPWQEALLFEQPRRALMLCSRQSGKTTAVAALALGRAWAKPGSLALLIAPSQRQAALLVAAMRKLLVYLPDGGEVRQETVLALRLANDSQVVALPALEGTVRGQSAPDLLVIDEAGWVPDSLYESVRPMLAVSDGSLVCMTTANGKRGFFYNAWTGEERWNRIRVLATECPRISAQFLAEERRTLPASRFASEYMATFTDAEGAVFAAEDIEAAVVAPTPGRLRFPTMARP
jgi:hypothetical protein